VVEGIARNQRVASRPSTDTGLNAHVRAKHDLHHVVSELERIQSSHGGQKWHDDLQIKKIKVVVSDYALFCKQESRKVVYLTQENEKEVTDSNGESMLQLGQGPFLGRCKKVHV